MKIIFLGFPKCGTLSFTESLANAGFTTAHYYDINGEIIGHLVGLAISEGKRMLHYVDYYDAITQMDWYTHNSFICPQAMFADLDKQYPGSKFILNTRNIDDHMRSIARWSDLFERMESNLRNPAAFMENHYKHVREYFEGRENFIEYNLDKDTDEILTAFLGRKINLVHINKTDYAAPL